MDFELLIPIVLFICITYAIKAVLDARTRGKLIAMNGSSEMIRALVQNDEQQSRYASLRWGIVLTAGWRLLLESAREIGSDFECATLLSTVAPQLPRNEDVVAAYRAALNTIDSDFERQRAAAALAVQLL